MMQLTGRQLPAAMDSRSRRAEDGGTLSLIFFLIYLFFPLTFCRNGNAILYSKSTQKYCLQLSYFGRTLHPENLEVIQLLNEFCRIGVAYSLRNFRAKIYSVSKRRQNDGAGQV